MAPLTCRRTYPRGARTPGLSWPLAGLITVLWGCGPAGDPDARGRGLPATGIPVGEALGGGTTAGYERALEPTVFDFPADHGPHPSFRNEWWYFTGNLVGTGGEAFGFQLTFFRIALASPGSLSPNRRSRWAGNQLYMAHFALTDVGKGEFHAFERFRREALELAGARAAPLRVWLDRWSLEGPETGAGIWPMRLRAEQDGIGIELVLTEVKGRVLQGDRGLSPKGPEPGNASYYYSLPRLRAQGTVTSGGERVAVTGSAWLDREWSSGALGEGVAGWDWFALQLDDGRELMLYQLRRRDGSPDPFSEGTLVDEKGAARRLAEDGFSLEVLDHWESRDGIRYPSRWRVTVPQEGLELVVAPRLPDQELRLTVRYWEGTVTVHGTAGSRPVSGLGYVELTGYTGGLQRPR